jgi:hypothetical protein
MAIEKKTVELGQLSNFLHYFEMGNNLDECGIYNFNHDQAFREGLKMSSGQYARLKWCWHNDKAELRKFMKQLKMI